jgi:hypothetical protein
MLKGEKPANLPVQQDKSPAVQQPQDHHRCRTGVGALMASGVNFADHFRRAAGPANRSVAKYEKGILCSTYPLKKRE